LVVNIGSGTNSWQHSLADGNWAFGPLASNSCWAQPSVVSNININVEFLILPK
jgi:hypothetical protein